MRALYLASAYDVLFVIATAWLIEFLRYGAGWLRAQSARERARCVALFAFAFFLSAAAFRLFPPRIRLTDDEPMHLATSLSLARRHSPLFVSAQVFEGDGVRVVSREISEKPLMFPFLVSLIHTIRGDSYRNAFRLNFLVLWGLLVLSGLIGRRAAGAMGMALAPIMVWSVPGVLVWATSASYDLLAASFSLLIAVLLWDFLSEPDGRFPSFLLASLLMYSQIRGEAIALVAALLAALVATGRIRVSGPNAWWIAALVPAAFLLRGMQGALSFHAIEILRPDSKASAAAFLSHCLELPFCFFSPFSATADAPSIYAQWSNSIAAVLLLRYGRSLFTALRTGPPLRWAAIALFFLGTPLFVLPFSIGAAHWGNASRYYLPLGVCFALIPLGIRGFLPRSLPNWVLMLVASVAAASGLLTARQACVEGVTGGDRVVRFVMQAIGDDPARRVFIVNDWANFTALGFASVPLRWAREHPEDLARLLSDPRRVDSYMLDEAPPAESAGAAAAANGVLDGRFLTAPMARLQVHADRAVRLYRLSLAPAASG